jgi:hypothetical protein
MTAWAIDGAVAVAVAVGDGGLECHTDEFPDGVDPPPCQGASLSYSYTAASSRLFPVAVHHSCCEGLWYLSVKIHHSLCSDYVGGNGSVVP